MFGFWLCPPPLDEIMRRDRRDENRKDSPLTVPKGAKKIDSSELTEEEVLEKMLGLIQKAAGAK